MCIRSYWYKAEINPNYFFFSSRFTDSDKYENEFLNCFKLEESRLGDICNACVLIVKRWRNLPKDTKKNWAHVVDARNGPGNKQSTRQKKKEDQIEKFEKIRKKRKNKNVLKRPIGRFNIWIIDLTQIELVDLSNHALHWHWNEVKLTETNCSIIFKV